MSFSGDSFVDPAFFTIVHLALKRRDSFLFFEKLFLENGLELSLIFVLF